MFCPPGPGSGIPPLVLYEKLERSANEDAVYRRGLSRLFSLRQLSSFSVRSDMLGMFYQDTVITCVLLSAGGGALETKTGQSW